MKELRKKTFLAIFSILTFIAVVTLILVNVQNYNREREAVERNFNLFDERGMRGGEDRSKPRVMVNQDGVAGAEGDDLNKFEPEQMMIMDHEVYTVELSDGTVSKIISHGNASDDFDIVSIAETIVSGSEAGSVKIGNLFFADYSYRYGTDNRIVVVNDSDVSARCRKFLIISIFLFAVFETLFAFIARLVTAWIVKPAEEAFDKQKEFIADASHELKTPLAVIMASAEELTDGAENRERLVDNIRYESDRMNRLIAQLLKLSKLEEGIKESYTEEDLSKLVEKTALAYEAVAFEQGVAVTTDIKKNVTLTCSRDEIEKMVSTILDNAIRHSYRDTDVKVELSESKGHILIKIENKGDPIPEGEEERIFERFYRGDASRNRAENRYGLGLAIAANIAKNHNGCIKAHSADGSTVFEIDIKR